MRDPSSTLFQRVEWGFHPPKGSRNGRGEGGAAKCENGVVPHPTLWRIYTSSNNQTTSFCMAFNTGQLLFHERWALGGLICTLMGVQGWHSGERTCLPPIWLGFDSQIWRQMRVEFVGYLLCTERFSPGTPVSPLLKNQNLTWLC